MAKKKHITPARRKRLERHFNEALRYHQAGNLAAAEKGYRRLIESDPEHCHGLHFLGLILRQRGQDQRAIELLQRAACTPLADATLMNNLGCMMCDSKRREESIPVFRKALELEPADLKARLNLAGLLLDYGQPEESRTHYQVVLDLEPENRTARIAMGAIEDAVSTMRQAIQIDPLNSEAHVHLAQALAAGDQVNEAYDIANQAVALAPAAVSALTCLGSIQMTLERFDLAQQTFRKILKLVPGDMNAYGELIHALVGARQEEEALAVCDEAFRVSPGFTTGYVSMGNALKQLGRLEEAIEAYKKAIELEPGHEAAHNNMGMTYMDLGDMTGAERCFEKALELAPYLPEPLFNLARMKKSSRENMGIIQRLEKMVAAGRLNLHERVAAHFALGKAYDDCQDYAQAFHHYQRANELKRHTVKFIPEKFVDWTRNFATTFTTEFFQRCRGAGVDSTRPIFIVGMPRSGTTLVEQIVSSHPRVYGADELTFLSEMTEVLSARHGGRDYPQVAAQLNAPLIREMALEYLQRVAALDDSADYVTDKMPSNYYHLGLIAVMFPRCHIIHCQRDAMDTCFSNYIQLFGDGHFYSYALEDIAVCYRAYEDLMAHWRQVLPITFHDVRLEDLVENQESVSRGIIDYLGLEWDDACLSFHENRRTVRTASHWQVRQPIFKTARRRWKNYAPYLEKLRRDIHYQDLRPDDGTKPA